MWTWSGLTLVFVLWYSQSSSVSAAPESGLEKAAAASAVIAGSDASSSNQQQQTDVETRLKRITDTIHRVRGPDPESSDRGHSERLVVANRPPSYQSGGASQSPYMVRNDELHSSGDGALGDDDEDAGMDGDFGSGDDSMFDPDGPRPIGTDGESVPSNGNAKPLPPDVYPVDVDEHTRKPVHIPTTTRKPAGGRGSHAGPTKKPYVESEHRHPTTRRPSGSSASSFVRSAVFSIWIQSLVSLSISWAFYRTYAMAR